tara:strand:- start:210 stop:500 length:291 start_codon:yes stop_codon:yes gene_type:complete
MKIQNYDKMGSTDKLSFHKVWKAYIDNTSGKGEIFEMGFNPNSGYAYIALECDIQIASCFGQKVDFIVTDHENGEEYFFDLYEEAVAKLIKLSELV